MRAVSPGRAAVQDVDSDHGRLYVAMAEKFLDREEIVAPSSECVADKWMLRVRCGRAVCPCRASTLPNIADVITKK